MHVSTPVSIPLHLLPSHERSFLFVQAAKGPHHEDNREDASAAENTQRTEIRGTSRLTTQDLFADAWKNKLLLKLISPRSTSSPMPGKIM
jgi:hypothetical protein